MMILRRIEELEMARNQAWMTRRNHWGDTDETIYWAANRELHAISEKLQKALNIRAMLYTAYKLTRGGSF